MTAKYDRLKALLLELFQLDKPDLDFGIYRIMHARAAEVTKFVDEDLLPQVKDALAGYESGNRDQIEETLAEAIASANDLGVDPEGTTKVKQLRADLEAAGDVDRVEGEVYDLITRFFSRYYSEGDFISQRRYSGENTYAMPYNGEEVLLHWANKDQYYTKTSEYLDNYSFLLNPADDANPMRVKFRLADADEGEHGNVKSADGKGRVFVLAPAGESGHDFVQVIDGELVVDFEFRPTTMTDWPDGVKALKTEPQQQHVTPASLAAISSLDGDVWAPWLEALNMTYLRADGSESERTKLEVHLERYAKKNTFDYFIHKDLGGFLRRELDFFIKNEVMHLDDVENADSATVEKYLGKLRAVRRVARKVIEFLAQLEDFQKKLWLKKKFVIDTRYLVTVGGIDDSLLGKIVLDGGHNERWAELVSDAEGPGAGTEMTAAALQLRPNFVLDTRLIRDPGLRNKAIESILDGKAVLHGTLWAATNTDALRLATAQFSRQIRLAYIDPPFNTGDDGFAYKDQFRHSSWLTSLDGLLAQSTGLLTEDGSLYAHIDYTEKERLRLLLDQHLHYETEIIWRIGWISGYKSVAKKFIRNHDTIYQYSATGSPLFNKKYIPYPEGYVRRDGKTPEGEGYPIEDTWNASEIDSLNSIQIISFSKEKVGDAALTQKNEDLIQRIIEAGSNEGDTVLDFFLGSGTTAATAMKLRRRWMGVENNPPALRASIDRLARVLEGDRYGISKAVNWTGGGAVKIVELESYEDTLNNLNLTRTDEQQSLLDSAEDAFREQYMLRYQFDVEAQGSASLLSIYAFDDPTNYELMIKQPGSDESRPTKVDLMETFNNLIGLSAESITAPRAFFVETGRDARGRLQVDSFNQDADGTHWFRAVTGTSPEGDRVLVIWRNRPGADITDLDADTNIEIDNTVLNHWFGEKQKYSVKDSEFDLIYVNGDNNLENMRRPDEQWKVLRIDDEFHRLMFDTTGMP